MSKRINTGYVSDPTIQQPFTTKSLDFIQDGVLEITNGIVKHMIQSYGLTYSTSVPYLIAYGTGVYNRYYFFNGELYLAQGSSASLYAHIDTTPDGTADPLLFSDNVNRNVHNNRYLTINAISTGALFAMADVINIIDKTNDELSLATQSTTSATYVDLTGLSFVTPNDGISRKYKLTFKSDSDLDGAGTTGSAIAQAFYRILNESSSTTLDESQTTTAINVVGVAQDCGAVVPAFCTTIVTLAPNTTIKCQFKLTSGTSVTATKAKLLIEQC